jgi:hypothetical protein
MTIDSILTEWSYRLPNGYPTRAKDYELLYHVILEMTDLSPLQARTVVNKAQGLNEQADGVNDELNYDRLKSLNLSPDIIHQILDIYDDLSPDEKTQFNQNYRNHTIQSFLAGGYKPFTKFYNIADTTKVAGGMGRGEIEVLLGVGESQSGGTSQHDIVLNDGEWEVKEIGKEPSITKKGILGNEPIAKTFRPAKSGMTQQGDLLSKLQDFFNDIVIPYTQMSDSYSELKHVVDSHSWERLQQFISILDKVFIPLISNVQQGREISYLPWQAMYSAFKLMHNVFWETDLDSDIQDTRLTIKTADSETSYWITADDYDRIKSGAGSSDPVSVHIGEPVENENSNAVLWFTRIKRSSFISNPEIIISEMNEIKNKFFVPLLGLIVYDTNRPGIPVATSADEWAIISLSQAQWVFGLKSAYTKYEFIQRQT